MRESGRLHTILLVGVVATLMIILLVGCEADTERSYAPLPDESRDDARTAQEPAKPAAEQPTLPETPVIVIHVPPTPTPEVRINWALYGVSQPEIINGNQHMATELLTYCGVERLRDAIFVHLLDAVPYLIVQPEFGSTYRWAPIQTDILVHPMVLLDFVNYQRGDWGETIQWELRYFDDSTGPDGKVESRGSIDERCHIDTKSVRGALKERFWGK